LANRKKKSFQEVQDLPPIQAAIRFLPNVIIGIILNVATGLLVHRLHANHLVLVTTVLSAGSPLLLAIIDPQWSWWHCAFWAVLLGPLSADGMTLGLLISNKQDTNRKSSDFHSGELDHR
jgi:hypothetical protein